MSGENTDSVGPLYTGTGQIANSDVAHEMYNQTVVDWEDGGGKEAEEKDGKVIKEEVKTESGLTKVGYFKVHGERKGRIDTAYKIVKLEESVRIDPKTGLPNDVEFAAQLSNTLERVRSGEISGVSVAMFDWDLFGRINDVFNGHDFGDLFLRHGANRMQKHVRNLFRRSGDEFYAIFDGLTNREILRQRLEELSKDFRANAFRDTIESALVSNRHEQIPGGHVERDGVWALQNILRGLVEVQGSKEKQQKFIGEAKGVKREKIALINTVRGLDLKRFAELIPPDGRTTVDLSVRGWKRYQKLLRLFAEEVIRLFDNITLSCGVVVITKENLADVPSIRTDLDLALYFVKEHGRNMIKIPISKQ